MIEKGIEVEWPVLLEWSEALQAIVQGGHLDIFTAYNETCGLVASYSLALYKGYLKGMPLPNGAAVQRPSGNVSAHAELKAGPGLCDYSLENAESYAEAIEKGTKERDMKAMLPTAKKARMAKDGSLYLIIPFRHGTQGAVGLKPMPLRVQQMAQEMKRSRVTGNFMEKSGTGFMVQRNTYKWGGKLGSGALAANGLSFKEQNRYQGMVKFGLKGHSSYITFRVMSQKSSGWIIPARPGLWPAKTAAEVAYKDLKGSLSEALLEDLLRLAGI
jgi:hypothetical protein